MSAKLILQQMDGQELLAARRRYVEILRGGITEEEVPELKTLMIELGKTADHVEADLQIMQTICQCHHRVKAARDIDTPIRKADEALAAFDAETKRLVEARQAARQPLHAEANRLSDLKASALSAIAEVNQLRNENQALLAEEPEPKLEA